MKNCSNSLHNLETQAWILLDFLKNRPFVTFPAIKKDCEVVWSQKLVRSKALTLEHPSDILNIPFRRLEKFLEILKSNWLVKNCSISLQNFETQAWILLDFPKNRPFVTFPVIKKDCEVVWLQKLVRSKALTLEHPLDTLNIPFRRLENFLGAFEVEVISEKSSKIQA